MKITKILAREIFDSRGWPTVQCDIELNNKYMVYASVPSGRSKGNEEAYELRDGGNRFKGLGVSKAIEKIEKIIAPYFLNKIPSAIDMDLKLIEIDGTPNKSNLGANTMLAVSMALYRAQAFVQEIELFELVAQVMGNQSVTLPFPLFNIINGGTHSNNNLNIQEFMIVPIGTSTFRSALNIGITIFHELEKFLAAKNISTCVGDEGGFVCGFKNDQDALEILSTLVNNISKKHSFSCFLALDIAANNFYNSKTATYNINNENLTTQELIDWYQNLTSLYPIYSLEDPIAEKDINGWHSLYKQLSSKVQIVGDDIFVTNAFKINTYTDSNKIADAVIIKPNQIGTITETLQAIKVCKDKRLNAIVSHRSGDTEDSFIADLAVGAQASQIKSGGLSRSERLAKYNRLLTIEDLLSLSLLDS